MPDIQQMMVLLGLFASVEATKFTTSSSESDGRSKFDNEIIQRLAALEEDNVKLKAQQKQIKTSGCKRQMPLPEEIGFTSKLSTRRKWTNYIVFDQLVSNMGSAYDNSTGIFIAPVSGTYMFYMTIRSHFVRADLAKNGARVLGTYSYQGHVSGPSGGYYAPSTSSSMAIIPLKTGDRVWVRLTNADYTGSWTDEESTFSGYLLRLDEGAFLTQFIG